MHRHSRRISARRVVARLAAAGTVMVCQAAGVVPAAHSQSQQLGPEQVGDAGFGGALALRDGELLVGAAGGSPLGRNAGSAHLYRLQEGEWRLVRNIHAPSSDGQGKRFGGAVALGERGALIGDAHFAQAVAAAGRVYSLDIGAAGVPQPLQHGTRGLGSAFGSAIVMARDRALVGAPGAVTDIGKVGGAVLFRHRDGRWTQLTRLEPPDGADRDAFGASVALRGVLALVGASGATGGTGTVHVFDERDNWRPVARLVPPDQAGAAAFGSAVAVDGGRILVGAPGALVDGVRGGAVYVFDLSEQHGWLLRQTLVSPRRTPAGAFGASLAAEGDMVAVGAPHDDAMGSGSGSVTVYRVGDAGLLSRVGELAVPTSGGVDSMGAAVAIDGGWLAAGAPGTAGGSGQVYLYRIEDLRRTEVTFRLVAHADEGAAALRFNALALDPQGFMFVGTYRGGLDVFDGTRFDAHRFDRADTESISSDGVLSLLVDQSQRIWVGTEDGVNRFDPRRDRFIRYRLRAAEDTPEPVVALYEDRGGTLWTGSNGRLYRYEPQADTFVEFEPFAGEPERLAETYISGIQEDSDGRLWVLTKNLWENHASLYSVTLASDTVTRFPLAREWGQVGPLLVDRRDRLWIKAPGPIPLPATAGEVVRPPQGVSDSVHMAFLEDHDGTVWIATRAGLYRARTHETMARLYRIVPSMPPMQSWDDTLSLFEEPQGTLLMGTIGGVYRVHHAPASAEKSEPTGDPAGESTPPLVLTGITVTGREGVRQVVPYGLSAVDLDANDYGVELRFALLQMDREAPWAARYRLVGFDRSWSAAQPDHRVRYTSLPPGGYTFEVIAESARSGARSRLTFAVRVAAPYWQTWWFRGAGAMLLVAAVVAVYRYRASRENELAALRERIAQDLHDDLSTNLSGIALLSERLSGSGSSPDRRALKGISATARGMLEDLRDLVWLVDPGHDSAQELLWKMREIAESLLGDAVEISGDGLTALNQLDATERREWLLVYKELLHNVVRHANASRVRIELVAETGHLHLRVTDDGVGFDPGTCAHGHGLPNLQARARRLGGEFSVSSAPGGGTRAEFSLPRI